jgi:hypothetical protein
VQHGADAGVARDVDMGPADAFRLQIACGSLGRGKVQLGHARGEHAVHFFRKRPPRITGPQSRFHVCYGHLAIERRERAAERSCGVSLDHHHVGPLLADHGFERRHHSGGGLGERLCRLHHVQIVFGRDAKRRQHLVQHGTVLRGYTNAHFEVLCPAAHVKKNRTQLDSFRPGTQHEQDLRHKREPPNYVRRLPYLSQNLWR